MECTAAPGFAELVMADLAAMGLWGGACALLIVAAYAYRGELRKWLD